MDDKNFEEIVNATSSHFGDTLSKLAKGAGEEEQKEKEEQK